MAELEATCAAAVEATWQPQLEKSVQAVLGAPTDRASWLTYRFDEAARSPVIFFAYPGALPRGVAYIAREVKIEFGSAHGRVGGVAHGEDRLRFSRAPPREPVS